MKHVYTFGAVFEHEGNNFYSTVEGAFDSKKNYNELEYIKLKLRDGINEYGKDRVQVVTPFCVVNYLEVEE